MSSPCPCTPTIGTQLARLDDTISTDTSADSSRDVCDPVSKLPPRSRQDMPLSCPRAYGLANTQPECGSGATLYVKFALIARR